MSLAIRELKLSDRLHLEELLDTFQPGWGDALAPGAAGPLAFLTSNQSFAFGAYANNDPAGWLWGQRLWRPDGRRMSYIHQLDVHADHRRQGIATMLVEAALSQARREGHHRVWLCTKSINTAAVALYEGLGGQHHDAPGDDVVFRWNL